MLDYVIQNDECVYWIKRFSTEACAIKKEERPMRTNQSCEHNIIIIYVSRRTIIKPTQLRLLEHVVCS
jgi:hypothetical protein